MYIALTSDNERYNNVKNVHFQSHSFIHTLSGKFKFRTRKIFIRQIKVDREPMQSLITPRVEMYITTLSVATSGYYDTICCSLRVCLAYTQSAYIVEELIWCPNEDVRIMQSFE